MVSLYATGDPGGPVAIESGKQASRNTSKPTTQGRAAKEYAGRVFRGDRRVTGCSTRVPHMVSADAMDAVRRFVAERDWAQFHTPENLAKSISIEAGELLECFQWSDDAEPERVQAELADVMTYCLLLSDRLGLDPAAVVLAKLEETRHKYPVDKARGRSAKYDQLPD